MGKTTTKNTDKASKTAKTSKTTQTTQAAKTGADELEKLRELIEGIDIAMLSTQARDGRLVSRPLRTQQMDDDGHLWFVTDRTSHKADEIEKNPQVNIAYAAPSDNTYVSVAGIAEVRDDRKKLHELWSPAMSLFYPKGKDDPDLCLLKVRMQSAEYWDSPGGFIGSALYLAMTAITGDAGSLSDNQRMEFGNKRGGAQ
ncbi:MAG: pyridoxamine 5'-phosphate oxidase family protein [Gammaproteobacteria bacterium]|nr:pyridoxamine 5'-phosphate oxidase family protein [Gammaproteobacteria bacterium]